MIEGNLVRTILAWIKASRLASQSYIFLPLLLGQALHVWTGGELDWRVFVLVQLFGLFDQLYIVYANDYADLESDTQNKTYTMFSGGSRVLVDGNLSPKQLAAAAWSMVALSLGCGVLLGFLYGRWIVLPLMAAGLLLLWAYSYPPIRLSYRGGGELLQALGVGVVLPLIGFAAQTGRIDTFPWIVLVAVLPTQLACAAGTALPDELSDRETRKHTAPVLMGSRATRALIVAVHILSIAALLLLPWPPAQQDMVRWLLLIPAASALAGLAFVGTRAGTPRMTLSVALSVTTTLSIMGIMAYAAFTG